MATLRPATPDDSEFAYRVKEAAFRKYIERVQAWDEEKQRRDHERRFREQEFFVVEWEEMPVGIVALEMRTDCLKLNQLFIHPDHQGRGIGAACMRTLIERADARRLPIRLQVMTVNPRAVRFYHRLGFRTVGDMETHLQMERSPCDD